MVLKMKAHIIDREIGNVINKEASTDLELYVPKLIENIEKSKGLSQYKSENSTMGVIALALESVKKCNDEFDEKTEAILNKNFYSIAFRFLDKETNAQEKVEQLNTVIKVGCLVQAIIKKENHYQYIIAKVDSTDYLNNFDLRKNRGIEISDKRLGKSCLIDFIKNENDDLIIDQIRILLDNKASYFHKEFLEVIPIYQDDINTKRMMATVLKRIDENLKSKYPKQRLLLRNTFIHHVRTNDFIDYNKICTEVFDKFLDNADCDIELYDREKLKSELQDLPAKKKFSPQFNKVSKEVKARIFQSEYALNKGIQLVISDIEQDELLKNIKSGKEDGGKQFIMIYTTDQEAISAFAPEETKTLFSSSNELIYKIKPTRLFIEPSNN